MILQVVNKNINKRYDLQPKKHQTRKMYILHSSYWSYYLQVNWVNTGCNEMIGAVWKLIIFKSMVNRILHISKNERVTLQVYDTCPQMFDVCTLHHTAHITALVQFLPYSDQQVRYDGLHSSGNSVLQIKYAHRLWWHKNFVLHVTPKEVVTRD